MKKVLTSHKTDTSLRWKKALGAVVLGAALLTPVLGGEAFAQPAKSPALSAWGDRDRRDHDRRDNDRNRRDRDRRDNDRRHDRNDRRDRDRNRYDRDRRYDNRWDRNDRNRYDYRPGYGQDYYRGSSATFRGVVLDVSERSGYTRVRADNGRVYTVRSSRRELDNLKRGERVVVHGRFQGSTVYADRIDER